MPSLARLPSRAALKLFDAKFEVQQTLPHVNNLNTNTISAIQSQSCESASCQAVRGFPSGVILRITCLNITSSMKVLKSFVAIRLLPDDEELRKLVQASSDAPCAASCKDSEGKSYFDNACTKLSSAASPAAIEPEPTRKCNNCLL